MCEGISVVSAVDEQNLKKIGYFKRKYFYVEGKGKISVNKKRAQYLLKN